MRGRNFIIAIVGLFDVHRTTHKLHKIFRDEEKSPQKKGKKSEGTDLFSRSSMAATLFPRKDEGNQFSLFSQFSFLNSGENARINQKRENLK